VALTSIYAGAEIADVSGLLARARNCANLGDRLLVVAVAPVGAHETPCSPSVTTWRGRTRPRLVAQLRKIGTIAAKRIKPGSAALDSSGSLTMASDAKTGKLLENSLEGAHHD
jgi:hypothetical protein